MDSNRQQTALLEKDDELDVQEPAWRKDQREALEPRRTGNLLAPRMPADRSPQARLSWHGRRMQGYGEDD